MTFQLAFTVALFAVLSHNAIALCGANNQLLQKHVAVDRKEPRRDGDQERGLQFIYQEMMPVDAFVRSSKVVFGRYEFQEENDGFILGRLHYPIENTSPIRYYVSGPYKIRRDFDRTDLKTFRGMLMIRANDDGVYDVVAYSVEKPERDEQYIDLQSEDGKLLSNHLFGDKKYRYENTLSEAIDLLSEEPRQGMLSLQHLKKDAKPALPALRDLLDHDNVEFVFSALHTIAVIDSEAGVTRARLRAMPRFIEVLEAKPGVNTLHSLQQLSKLGSDAEQALPAVIETMQLDRSHPMWDQITTSAIECMLAIAPESEQVRNLVDSFRKKS